MVTRLTDPDLQALDEIWPIGRQLRIPDGGRVVIAGAYRGRYMHYVVDRYPKSWIIGFEPQMQQARYADQRVGMFTNCQIWVCALGTRESNGVRMGQYGTDGCSLVNLTGNIERVFMEEFGKAMKRRRISQISCFICNMEGYEYELLPHIFRNDLHKQINSMAIQFHSEFAKDEKGIRLALDRHYGKYISSPGWHYWFNA